MIKEIDILVYSEITMKGGDRRKYMGREKKK
jgi:hypothetical protein